MSLRDVTRTFGGHAALRSVSLDLRAGEIVGLVGPNGAGKSTLIKIIDRVLEPTSGKVSFPAERAGKRTVGVVHQDLGLVETLSVEENLRIGMPSKYLVRPILNLGRESEAASAALERVGLPTSYARRQAGTLSLGEQTLVAVARTLEAGSQLVIMDEATSALSPAESGWLRKTLRERAAEGAAVVMVSHKLSEVIETTDRCLVVVDGRLAADVRTADLDRDALVALMSPAVPDRVAPQSGSTERRRVGAAVLTFRAARTAAVGPFDMEICAGEVVGITGLVGSGLYELAYLASGHMRPISGEVIMRRGTRVGLLPPDRLRQGNFPTHSVQWNLTVSSLDRWRTRFGSLRLGRELNDAQAMHTRLNVQPTRLQMPQASLSGGNQQKVLFGRLLLTDPQLLVLTEPTRGVDVATRKEIYELIRDQRRRGVAVLVISSDAEDLTALADRVGVIEAGSCTALRPTAELDEGFLLKLV